MNSINEFFVVAVSQGNTWHEMKQKAILQYLFSRESFGIAAESQ